MQSTNSSVQRIRSIDAFRGLTIFIMIFVNELAGVKGMPAWMEHMPSNGDGMTFVDVVFPAFLFIVGMSIPFAIANRIAKGDNFFQLQKHILLRTLGLLVLGVYMVNAEEGYNQATMPLSIFSWSLFFYLAAFMIWHVRLLSSVTADFIVRAVGVFGLLYLALIFRAGAGDDYLSPQWWGILGLIGWAFLLGSVCYQLTKGDLRRLIATLILCVVYYGIAHSHWAIKFPLLALLFHCDLTAAHGSIVLCGVITSQIFFQRFVNSTLNFHRRCLRAILFAAALIVAAWLLRPEWPISKIAASPSWCLYSAAICVMIFMLVNYVVDVKQHQDWMKLFAPAAGNPLLTYLLPFVVYAMLGLLSVSLPEWMRQGATGLCWALGYSFVILILVHGLNKLNLRLQL